jgi:hypothetical protein
MSEWKKKESPEPLVRAVDSGAPVKPLAPVRRLVAPLGIAAALVLAGGGASAYAFSQGEPKAASVEAQGQAMDPIEVSVAQPQPQPTQPIPDQPKVAAPVVVRPAIQPHQAPPPTAGVMPPPHLRRHLPIDPRLTSNGTTL